MRDPGFWMLDAGYRVYQVSRIPHPVSVSAIRHLIVAIVIRGYPRVTSRYKKSPLTVAGQWAFGSALRRGIESLVISYHPSSTAHPVVGAMLRSGVIQQPVQVLQQHPQQDRQEVWTFRWRIDGWCRRRLRGYTVVSPHGFTRP